MNVTAADTEEDAKRQTTVVHRNRVRAFMGRQGKQLSDDQLDTVVNSYQGRQITDMLRYTAEGTGEQVAEYLENFRATAQADELMISLQAGSHEETGRSMEILAEAWN